MQNLKTQHVEMLKFLQAMSDYKDIGTDYILNCTQNFNEFSMFKSSVQTIFESFANSKEGILLYHSVGVGKTLFSL